MCASVSGHGWDGGITHLISCSAMLMGTLSLNGVCMQESIVRAH